MAEAYSLLEFLQQLSLDSGLRADFDADPQSTLAEHGLGGLTAEDVHDAAVLVQDTRTADFSLDHALGPDPAAGFLDAFLPGEPAYLPVDLGESVDLPADEPADVPADGHDDVPEHTAGFGTGHAALHETSEDLPADSFTTEHHAPAYESYGEHYAALEEHGDPDLADVFGEHPDPASAGEHHIEPPAH